MIGKENIDKLVNVVDDLIRSNANIVASNSETMASNGERLIRIEIGQENMATAITRISDASTKAIDCTVRLETAFAQLEEKAVNKIVLVEDSLNSVSSKVYSLEKDIVNLKIINAEKLGERKIAVSGAKLATSNFKEGLRLVIGLLCLTFILGVSYQTVLQNSPNKVSTESEQ
jgi:hypothetical protein